MSQEPLDLQSSAISPDGAWIFNKTTQSKRGVHICQKAMGFSKAWAFMMGTMPTCIPRVRADTPMLRYADDRSLSLLAYIKSSVFS